MRIVRLNSVDGFVVFDLDRAPSSAGGTRLAPDVTEQEVAQLARAMTYKFAALGAPMGGAKAGVRADPTDAASRAQVMARFCDDIRPLVASRAFLTGPDLGTYEGDFAPLRDVAPSPQAVSSIEDGISFEDVVTGFGVAAAADTAIGGLRGRSVAVEGFGKVGGGVAREVVRRGGAVVAVSTLAGAVHDPGGLDVEALWEARRRLGDRCVETVGRPLLPASALFGVAADVLVPGARPGVVNGPRSERLDVAAVVPAANVPYTADALQILRRRGIAAHADFICNAGAVIAFRSALDATRAQVLAEVEARIADLVRRASAHSEGPYAGACELARRFLSSWWEGVVPDPPPAAA